MRKIVFCCCLFFSEAIKELSLLDNFEHVQMYSVQTKPSFRSGKVDAFSRTPRFRDFVCGLVMLLPRWWFHFFFHPHLGK